MSFDASSPQVLATTKEELADKTQLLKEEKALTFKLTRDGEAYRFRIQVRALFFDIINAAAASTLLCPFTCRNALFFPFRLFL